jgi:hypothetical protein
MISGILQENAGNPSGKCGQKESEALHVVNCQLSTFAVKLQQRELFEELGRSVGY